MASSSRRVRTARTPVEAIPRMSPTMLVASRITEIPLAAGAEEADDRAGRGGDADRAPGIAAHVLVGRGHGDLGAFLHRVLHLAELLARDLVLARHLRLVLVELRGALVLDGFQQFLGFRDHVLDVTADGIGLCTALHGCLLAGARGYLEARRMSLVTDFTPA